MSTLPRPVEELVPVDAKLVALTLQACQLAKTAAGAAAECLAGKSATPFSVVDRCEKELDNIDREIDERVTLALSQTPALNARELLACLKLTIDLERIGDLISSFVCRARALGTRVPTEDTHDLIKMASALEGMLADAYHAFSQRDLDRAVAILRADAEVDRLRNLIVIRRLEEAGGVTSRDGIHVLFMAQALERAGDHAKNLAEEVCHLVSGQTMRHVLRDREKPCEQMYLDWLRDQQDGG